MSIIEKRKVLIFVIIFFLAGIVAILIRNRPEATAPIVWRARDLYHFAGKAIPDAEASGGIAWTTDSLIALMEGLEVPASGEYALVWRIKPRAILPQGALKTTLWYEANRKRIIVGSRINTAMDFRLRDQYQNFDLHASLPALSKVGYEFRSLVGVKYSFLLDTVELHQMHGNWTDKRRVEELKHTMGVWKVDHDTASGRAWSNENTLVYGPYTKIGEPGKYVVTWRLKLARPFPANEPILLLDVFAHDGWLSKKRQGHKKYVELLLTGRDFPSPEKWESRSLEFQYDGAQKMEFRAFARVLEPNAILLDTAALRKEQSTH